MRGAPDCALEDEIVTIRPHFAASMSGTAACTQWKVPVRLTAIMRSHAATLILVKDSNASSPALVYDRDATGNVAPKRIIRNGPKGSPALTFTNASAAAFDTKRDALIVPN